MPALPGEPYIGRMPVVAVVTDPQNGIPEDAGRMLSAAVQKTLDKHLDGARFEVSHDGSGQWTLLARTDSRAENEPLVEPFFNRLIDCVHSLPPGPDATALVLILMGGATIDPDARLAEAKSAGQQMADNLRADGCKTARNTMTIQGDFRDHFESAARGMLTEEFDQTSFGDRAILDIADVLHPLFFGLHGLWAQDRSQKLKAIVAESLASHVPPAAAFESSKDQRFTSFFDFVITVNAGPSKGVVTELFAPITNRCLPTGRAQDLYEPFRLGDCVNNSRLGLVPVMVGNETYVLLTSRSEP